MQTYRPTRAEINLANIAHNVREFRRHIPQPTRLMAVVKADGYGHGAVEVSRAALAAGAEWLAVALAEEGIRLRQAGLAAPVLILGYLPPESIGAVIQYRLTPGITDRETLELLEDEARRQRRRVGVHVKVDTGMGRLGLRGADGLDLARRIMASAHLELEGIYTHFAAADEADKGFTLAQLDNFKSLVETIKKEKPQVIAHCANSAAAIEIPQARFDMVRIGISLYGLYPSPEVKPLVALRGHVSAHPHRFVKEVPAHTPSATPHLLHFRPAASPPCPWDMPTGTCGNCREKPVLIRGAVFPRWAAFAWTTAWWTSPTFPVGPGEPVVVFSRQGDGEISADELPGWRDNKLRDCLRCFFPGAQALYTRLDTSPIFKYNTSIRPRIYI